MYMEGVFITEISRRTGFGTTTIFRWAQDAGIVKPLSERIAHGATRRQLGRESVGKKGVFHTAKGGAWVHTDSTYEFARLEQLEADPDVVLVSRCELRVPYVFDGRARTYTPDFYVETTGGKIFVEEIKPLRWVSDPLVVAKACAAAEVCASIGAEFRIVTEREIGAELIRKAAEAAGASLCDEAVAAATERRRKQRRAAQRRLMSKFRASATEEQMAEFRAKSAAYTRECRARKASKAA